MTPNEILQDFAGKHQCELTSLSIKGFDAYALQSKDLIKILEFLKSEDRLKYTILTDLFAADFIAKPKRFEIVYNLLSLKLNKRMILKVYAGEEDKIPSIEPIFKAAVWYEREAFDMYGILFEGNPDMRRILTDYGFKGHPLRKDFPLTGHLEVRYDEKLEKVIYEPVVLEHEFRDFDFMSPWQGPKEYKLPGDEKATK
jgi:NADH-quinone oxidoreductase subunit C